MSVASFVVPAITMIVLHDEIEIHTTPGHVFNWFARLDENYLAWHPDHVACRYLSEGPLREGFVMICEEYLHGELHKLKIRMTKIIPNSRIEYKAVPGMHGAFVLETRDGHTLFVAELCFGIGLPLLDRVVDGIMGRVFASQLAALSQHMVEEGQNLKRLLETGDD